MEQREGKFTRTKGEIKEYIQLQLDLFRLNMLEKSSKILSLLIMIIVFLLLSVITLAFLSMGLMYKLADLWNSQILAALGIGGLYIILIILMLIFKQALFINPFVKQLSRILFDDNDEDDDDSLTKKTNVKGTSNV